MNIEIDLGEYTSADAFRGRTAARGIIRRDGKYLMVRGKSGDYKFPGGGTEQGETLTDTLKREIAEETGYSINPESVRFCGITTEKRTVGTEDILVMTSYYYVCETDGNAGERKPDEYEAVWTELSEALHGNRHMADTEHCPWIIREMKVMEYLLSDAGQNS